jgi:hypothetical protein
MTAPDPATILTRRFGYGPAGAQPRDAGGLLAGLAGADLMAARHPAPSIAEAAGLIGTYRRLNTAFREARDDTALAAERDAARQALGQLGPAALRGTLARAVASATPFRERLSGSGPITSPSGPRGSRPKGCREPLSIPRSGRIWPAALPICWRPRCCIRRCCNIWTSPARSARAARWGSARGWG